MSNFFSLEEARVVGVRSIVDSLRSEELQYSVLFNVTEMGRGHTNLMIKKWMNSREILNPQIISDYASQLRAAGESFEVAPNDTFTIFADEVGNANQSTYVVIVPNSHTGFKRIFIAVEVNNEEFRYAQVVYGPILPTTIDHDIRSRIYLKFSRESDMLVVCNEEEHIEI